MSNWLSVTRGEGPLIVSVPHAGTEVPDEVTGLRSLALARRDADLYVDRLYAFAAEMGATVIATAISRSVIDVNRDPGGVSLYPGQATTGLCPETTFDGEPLYAAGSVLEATEIARRREQYFDPYHTAIASEVSRLRALHPTVIVYDAHSIRSRVPRLFEGELPLFNIGSFDGRSCSNSLTTAVAAVCPESSRVVNGRFKGGWITRHYGEPARGVHAIQMELAIRGYLDEAAAWPLPWDDARAQALQTTLRGILLACLSFAKDPI